jgi:general secretion pathway protein F
VLFLAFAVLPQFELLFEGAGDRLPATTAAMLAAGAAIRDWWWAGFAVLALGTGALVVFVRAERGRAAVDARLLTLPSLGPALRRLDAARFAATLAALVDAGAPLAPALRTAAGTVANRAIRRDLGRAAAAVSEGRPLHAALADAGALPRETVDMIRIGEESGAVADMLGHVARLNEERAERALSAMIGALSPALTLLLGGLVALLMSSIISAVFSINAVAF